MKVCHICTLDNGGAGIAAYRLHLGLKSIGLDSKMLVMHRSSSDKDVVQFNQRSNITRRLVNKITNKIIKSEYNICKYIRPKGLDLFSDDRTIYFISKHPFIQEADIIHLHWIAFMVNYSEFFTKIKKPIVWTLHDMNPFTGGCHYSGACKKYEVGCGACPQLGSTDQNDLSRK